MHSFLENLADVVRIVTFQPGQPRRRPSGARWVGAGCPAHEAEQLTRPGPHEWPRSRR